MIHHSEAWGLIKATHEYYFDEEGAHQHFIVMNDVWGWATSDCFRVNDENVGELSRLYGAYGRAGFFYYQADVLDEYKDSEFEDVSRALNFVRQEERIRKEYPKAYYAKCSYTLGVR